MYLRIVRRVTDVNILGNILDIILKTRLVSNTIFKLFSNINV
jgi:hypothetical protein